MASKWRPKQDLAWRTDAKVKGKSRLWSDGPRGGEAWARLGAEGPRQRWRASEAKVDGLEVYVMVWVIHIIWDDQVKDKWIISSDLLRCRPSLRNIKWEHLDLSKAKVWNIGCFILPAMRCVEKMIAGLKIDSRTIKGGKHVFALWLSSATCEL